MLESTIGVKFYADTAFFKLFTEIGIGYYQRYNTLHIPRTILIFNNNDGLGINFGLGTDFKLNSRINFIIKGKVHFPNVNMDSESHSFGDIYTGIKYNF